MEFSQNVHQKLSGYDTIKKRPVKAIPARRRAGRSVPFEAVTWRAFQRFPIGKAAQAMESACRFIREAKK